MLGVQRGQLSFTKGCIVAVIWFSLSRTLNRVDRFEFWQLTSQLVALDVCMFDVFA
ncbi:TPA: DUF645 family protein [Vibrio vulnificus]|nr:DUF645 family protein [Vibrio vulnificus]